MYLIHEKTVRANKAWIENEWICIRLEDNREIRFPAYKNKRLAKASSEQLAEVELICDGTGLHWESLDEDLSIVGILEGRLG
ncbi:MAG: DUF2442 domain-containing protein [Microcystaceae cyanobacterium]